MMMNMVGPSDGQIPSTCTAGSSYTFDTEMVPYIKWNSCINDIFEFTIYADAGCADVASSIQVSKDKVVALFSGICTDVSVSNSDQQIRIVNFNGTLPSCQDDVSSCGNFCFTQDLLPDAVFTSDTQTDNCSSLSQEYADEADESLCQEQRMDYASHCCSGGFFASPMPCVPVPGGPPCPVDGGHGDHGEHGGDGGDGGHGGDGGDGGPHGGDSAEMQYMVGEPLPLGEFCQGGSFTPEMNLTFVCHNLTALACCNQGGQAGEGQCEFSLSSADAYASAQTICSENGGYEGANANGGTCNTSFTHREFPGVDWCQRRACPDCSHSWAQQLATVSSCCGAAGTVCDTAPPSICADSNAFMPDLSFASFCDGLSSTDCCAMGGEFQMSDDQCSVLRNGTCKVRAPAEAAQTDCESAGGTFRPDASETCQMHLVHRATNWAWNSTDSCETTRPEGRTVADEIMYLVRQGCCGSAASVCSGGSASAEADLCQVPANFMASAVLQVNCMGLDAATCAGLDGEAEENMCGEATVSSCEIVSLAGESAGDRCTTAGGTYSSMASQSCSDWAGRILTVIGSFTTMEFPGGPYAGESMSCGSTWGDSESINEHLFRAGAACCSDETSVCMGQDVHVVSAEMTLNMASTSALADSSGQLSSNATAALSAAIAAQTGADLSEVTNVTVAVKVKGSAPMTLADAAAAQAFVASPDAKLAVEAGLAVQVDVPPASVTATLSLADTATETAVADATVTAAADAAVTATTTTASRRLTQEEDLRRLQAGTVNVDYEILADLSNSDTMTASLQAVGGAAALSGAINDELAANPVEGIDLVTVTQISAEPEVTISYQIRTVDADRAQQAQTNIAEASAGGDAQATLMSNINSQMEAMGVSVNITGMTVAEPVLEVEDTGDAAAPVSRTDSSGTFRLGCRNFVMAFSAAVAMSLLQL